MGVHHTTYPLIRRPLRHADATVAHFGRRRTDIKSEGELNESGRERERRVHGRMTNVDGEMIGSRRIRMRSDLIVPDPPSSLNSISRSRQTTVLLSLNSSLRDSSN